ncbi:hypothetical protein AOC36_10490 [Erysipelothrix larvae]|uniref:Phospholipid/glycerol acyltransferase domain-containing protein n=1 Tax=Erysipelothrix larvae TaxID=1514105 RepID=A0A0X8H1T2_9FIRM|nr:lysophospholipid acyltransferase family protein [Erysipelothrix larvae]AMC94384.1 hypothetical protein AOC36_10490 [Erysipelothrix larvae]
MKTFNMIVTFMVLPVYWIRSQWIRRFCSEQKGSKELQLYPKHYLGFRRIRVEAHGYQPDANIPCIYVSNHQSMNDIFVSIAAVNRPFRFIAKKELFTNLITGTFMKMSRSYPLDRDDPRQSLKVLKQAVDDVSKGVSALAFPEGTRSHAIDMLPFKDGIFSVLRKSSAPIVPMYIKESFNERQKVMHVYFCEPIYPETYKEIKGAALSEYVFKRMNDMKEWVYEH